MVVIQIFLVQQRRSCNSFNVLDLVISTYIKITCHKTYLRYYWKIISIPQKTMKSKTWYLWKEKPE